MTAILNTLLEITVFSAVLYGAILLFQKTFRKHISAALNYAVWALLILRLIIPVTVDSGLHLVTIPDEPKQVMYTETPNNNAPIQSYTLPEEPTIDNINSETPINNETNNTALSTQNQIKPWNIGWQTVLVLLWGAGVLCSFGFVAILWRRLQLKIKRCGIAAPVYVLKLVNRCKSDMGIKIDIHVSVQSWLKSPALSVSPRPMLLLPEQMLHTMDAGQLEFGIRHELAHYLRRDYLMNLLLMVLRCVYWFNPVIYLAFRSLQTDMETACDARVTSRLKNTERMRYIRTMIDLGGSGNMQYVLGMGMSKGGREMEKRVRGIFMREITRMPVRMAAALLAGLMLVVCFTTACKPTPETKVVVGRQEDILENVSTVAPDDFKPINVPEHISEVYDDYPYLKISYDADVVVPETIAYPVTEVSKKVFLEKDILSYIDLLIDGDYEMYAGWTQTKDDFLSLLTKAKQYEGTERVTKDDLDRLQELYNKATNDVENPRISSLSELPEHISLNIKNGNNIISSIGFKEGGNSFGYTRDKSVAAYAASMVTDSQYTKNMDGPIEHYRWLQPGKPDISQEHAYAIAQQYMDELGVDLDLYSAEPCSFIKNLVDKTTGWKFTFMRRISNLRAIDDTGGFYLNPDAMPSYGAPWGEEKLTISVDKYGLFGLGWNGASEISRTVKESAQLEDFGTIQQRITNQLNYIYAFWGEEEKRVLEIKITKIELGVSMMSIEDQTDIGEYIPTWYVTYYYKFNDKNEYSQIQQIMFSAIDGSYIEPRVTNKELMGDMDISSDGASSASSG